MCLNKLTSWIAIYLLSSYFYAVPASAAPQPSTPPTQTNAASSDTAANNAEQEIKAASEAAGQALQEGPKAIPLVEQATLNLPIDYGFIPKDQAKRLLIAMGNSVSDELIGIIVPQTQNSEWFMVVNYAAAGYIKDDDAKNWNADDLLNNIRQNTLENNNNRKARGLPELEVVGWIEKPLYNQQTKQLVWSIESKEKNQASSEVNGINYNTLTLGREGYISMNLVTNVTHVNDLKPTVKTLLAGLQFDSGKRYADFNASTDKVAEYGLAALIAGVAAKKLGLIAVITGLAIKFWKLAVITFFGLGGLMRKFFGRK